MIKRAFFYFLAPIFMFSVGYTGQVEFETASYFEGDDLVGAEKPQASDPRVNSDRPRVTHRGANDVADEYSQGAEKKMPQSRTQQPASGMPPHNEPTPQQQQQQKTKPAAQPKQKGSVYGDMPEGADHPEKSPQKNKSNGAARQPKQSQPGKSTRQPNRNSVYNEQESSSVNGEVSQLPEQKKEPNRVVLISRMKESQLIAADRSVPTPMQKTVPAETKKVQLKRENPAVQVKKMSKDTAQTAPRLTRKERTEAAVSQMARPPEQMGKKVPNRAKLGVTKSAPAAMSRTSSSHATVYEGKSKVQTRNSTSSLNASPGERALQRSGK